MDETQGEPSELCVTHKEKSYGSEHLVLADICADPNLRGMGNESLATGRPIVGAFWQLGNSLHPHWVTGLACVWEPG
jgi:hypothetical protein